MNRWMVSISALPLLFAAGMFGPGCGSDSDDCALRATCADGKGGTGPGGGGAGQGGEAQGGQGQGGQGGQGQGGDMPAASCLPWENAAGVGVPASCGVFVASDGGGDGSQASPFNTLGSALSDAQPGTSIYLCNGMFEESVAIPSGVTIYGGLDCAGGWTYESGAQTTLIGEANVPAARFSDGNQTTTLYDIELAAADATSPGASSVAALIEGGTVYFERVDVLAGDGADGEPGDTPTTDIGPSDPNDSAVKGNGPVGDPMGICGEIYVIAAQKVNTKCSSSIGGASGQGEVDSLFDASDGNDGQVSGGSGGNAGGGVIGTCGSNGCPCGVGGSGAGGADGQPGMHGAGASGVGVLTSSGWVGADGLSASRGTHGAGGGGGAGAQSGGSSSCGRGGNGGGAGGCGGFGGLGGHAAGGSFAVIVRGGAFSTSAGSLSTSKGGTGGAGGDGQGGAVGGNGGSGGACGGGKGGDGGDGGRGGGGLGGHSIAVAHAPGITVLVDATTQVSLGSAGLGGTGGDAAGNGEDGRAEQIFEIDG